MRIQRKRKDLVINVPVPDSAVATSEPYDLSIPVTNLDAKIEILQNADHRLWQFMQSLITLYDLHHEATFMDHTYLSRAGITLHPAPIFNGQRVTINGVPIQHLAIDNNANIMHVRFMLFTERRDIAGAPEGGYHYEFYYDYVAFKHMKKNAKPDLTIGYVDESLTTTGEIEQVYVYNFVYSVHPHRSLTADVNS